MVEDTVGGPSEEWNGLRLVRELASDPTEGAAASAAVVSRGEGVPTAWGGGETRWGGGRRVRLRSERGWEDRRAKGCRGWKGVGEGRTLNRPRLYRSHPRPLRPPARRGRREIPRASREIAPPRRRGEGHPGCPDRAPRRHRERARASADARRRGRRPHPGRNTAQRRDLRHAEVTVLRENRPAGPMTPPGQSAANLGELGSGPRKASSRDSDGFDHSDTRDDHVAAGAAIGVARRRVVGGDGAWRELRPRRSAEGHLGRGASPFPPASRSSLITSE